MRSKVAELFMIIEQETLLRIDHLSEIRVLQEAAEEEAEEEAEAIASTIEAQVETLSTKAAIAQIGFKIEDGVQEVGIGRMTDTKGGIETIIPSIVVATKILDDLIREIAATLQK